MSPLIRKELRLILPVWLLAMALAVLPIWFFWPAGQVFVPQSPGALVFVPFGLGVLLLGITPFGGELSLGTFSVLLAQPVPRRRLWVAKITVLALALAFVFVTLYISNHLRVDSVLESMKSTVWRNAFRRPGQTDKFFLNLITDTRKAALRDTLMIGGLSILAAFAGGLWTTLLFRQTSAAFWSTLLVPMALGLLTAKLLGGFHDSIVSSGLLIVFGLYAVAGVLWAWRLFVRVQDVQWTGGIISLPAWAGSGARGRAIGTAQRRRPFRALLRNEFQSQYINLLIATGLLVVHLAILIFRKIDAGYLVTHSSGSLAMILESFPLLWLALPLLVGSVAVAEERKLGTFENLLCLPTTRRLQFITKLGFTLAVGVLLGAVLPLVIERLGRLVGLTANPSGLWVLNESRSVPFLLLFGSVGLSLLAFFGSTLTRNTLQALGAGVLVSVLGFLLIAVGARPPDLGDVVLWRGLLVALIGGPVLVFTVLALAYGNYNHLQPDLRTWFRNGLALLIALTSMAGATTAIYHRVWEAWLPPEPTHRFSGSYYANREHHFAATPKLQASISATALLLPDGRLWLRHRPVRIEQVQAPNGVLEVPHPEGWRAAVMPGSNWRDVAASVTGCFGLQDDGTLWDLSQHGTGKTSAGLTPKQVGTSHDWKSICAGLDHFTALRSDGTLWEWGDIPVLSGKGVAEEAPHLWSYPSRSKHHKHVAVPTRVGTDNDWIAAADREETRVTVKTDGSIWRWGRYYSMSTKGRWQIAERPERWLVLPGRRPVSISFDDGGIVAVCDDGTLWFGGDRNFCTRLAGSEKAEMATREMAPWGEDSDWREVKLWPGRWGGAVAVGVKRDGSLWQWDTLMTGWWPNPRWIASRSQPSRYQDWLTVFPEDNAFLAFAGDGSLCLWRDPREGYFGFNDPDARNLLLPSRIKARRIATILW